MGQTDSYGAIWYPGSSEQTQLNLSPAELESITAQMAGTPVTYNHQGVFDVLETNKTFKELAKQDPIKGQVGKVVGAFSKDGKGYCVISPEGPIVSDLMKKNLVTGVSLSHGTDKNGNMRVLELSLTHDPARSQARIQSAFSCYNPVEKYINLLDTIRNNTMEVVTPAVSETPELTPCELAINSLPEEHRGVSVFERPATMCHCRKAVANVFSFIGYYCSDGRNGKGCI
jgi:hypothetical protein